MSEKQARIKRKSEPEKMEEKKSGSALFNWITAIVIIAFLGLGGYAVKDNIKALLPERPEKEATVSDLAKDRDMTVEEFIEEYGLSADGVTGKTTESEVVSKLTVANYAKYTEKEKDELLAEYGIESADSDMLWQEAYLLMPMSKYAENIGMTFDDLKEQAGFPDKITGKTTLGDAEKILQELQAQTEEDTAE